jgi:hypothetical protein
MDLLSIWNKTREEPQVSSQMKTKTITASVNELVQEYTRLWWNSQRSFPSFQNTYRSDEQTAKEKQLDRLTSGLIDEIKHMPSAPAERAAWQERLRPEVLKFAKDSFRFEQRHIDFIESSGMLAASREFARMARQFDPRIRAEDIYQAGRNVMTMNFFQLLLGLPVEVTPSVFAYSMLYPYTDNYLDDPAVSDTIKLAFNSRFQRRLKGEAVPPANDYEATISNLVSMIEIQWDRKQYPGVYESLLAIHAAQARSLELVSPGASPFEFDVLGGSFEKGGTSVLADGYLVAGSLTPGQARMAFGYGSFTQLMDDLEDIQNDQQEGRLTLFSQTAGHWPLDRLTNQLFHFGRSILHDLSDFDSPATPALAELIHLCIDPILIDTVGRSSRFYSKAYLHEMERHLPFRYTSLQKQRDKLSRQKIGMGRLIETLL